MHRLLPLTSLTLHQRLASSLVTTNGQAVRLTFFSHGLLLVVRQRENVIVDIFDFNVVTCMCFVLSRSSGLEYSIMRVLCHVKCVSNDVLFRMCAVYAYSYTGR